MKITTLYILLAAAGSVYAVTQPPLMLIYPPTRVPFKPGETVQLQCRASGEPQPTYTWRKDKHEFNPAGNDDRIVKLPNEGTLVFNKPEAKDVGMYQCFANNTHGIAMSVVFDLRMAMLESYIKVNPKNIVFRPGAPLMLKCNKPTSYPDAKMTWMIKWTNGDFEGVDFSKRITMDHEANLIFSNALKKDADGGRAYFCMATNKFVRESTFGQLFYLKPKDVQAEDYAPDLMKASPTEMVFKKGETVKLKCIFGGHPTPSVSWFRNGKIIQGNTRYKFASFGLELNIPNADYIDKGSYECKAQASGFSENPRYAIKVIIVSTPEWLEKPESVVTSVGSSVSFFCNATSQPPYFIHNWFINGKKVDSSINQNKFIVQKTNLTVVNLTPQDAMSIQCNISNIYGYVFTNAFLNVLAEAPELLEDQDLSIKVSEGQSTNITCRTTGYGSVQVNWFKDNKQMTGGRYRTLGNGNLNIKKLVVADAGIYHCNATNRYGTASARRTLIIRRKTRIEQFPFNLESNEDLDAKFTCAGTTDPMEVENLRIIWMKDGRPIATNEERMIQNSQDNSLTISGITIRDAGRYTCVATNGLDNASASAFLTVRARPESPSNVKVICQTDTADVSWISGSSNNAPIQFYIIQANTSFDPNQWSMVKKVSPTEKNALINLSPWTNYTFRVLAQNKIGESEPSDHTDDVCRSKPQGTVPYQQPSNVHTRGDRKGYLKIMWTIMPPITHNGPDFQYVIQVKRANSTDDPITQSITDWRVNNVSIQTNNIYRAYDIIMRVKNSIGDANKNPVKIVGYSGEDTPNAIVYNPRANNIRATTATIIFDGVDPNSLQIRGKFSGYKIQFWKRGQRRATFQDHTFYMSTNTNNSTRTKRSLGAGEVKVELTNIYPYSDVEAQVLVMNSYYVGAPSDIFSFKTAEGVPGPVPFLVAVVRGSNHFLLNWDQPNDKNGYVVGYDIGFQTVTGLNLGKLRDMEPQVTDATLKQIRLTGLRSSQLYRVYIWARTILGKGDPYFIDVETIKPSIPTIPIFSFVHIDFHYVNISWPENLKTDLHGSVYYIEYRKEESSDWQQTTDESVVSWKNVTNLESGTDYEFRLVATNGKETRASEIQETTTYGHFVGFAGTSGWLYGMLVALLVIVCIGIVLYVMRDKISQRRQEKYKSNMHASKSKIGSSSDFQDDVGYINDGGRQLRPLNPYSETRRDDSSIQKSRSNMSVTDGAPSPDRAEDKPPNYEQYARRAPSAPTTTSSTAAASSDASYPNYDPDYDDYNYHYSQDQGRDYENYGPDGEDAAATADQYYGAGGYYGDEYYNYDDYGAGEGGYYEGEDGQGGYNNDDGTYEDYERKRLSSAAVDPSHTEAYALKFTSNRQGDTGGDGTGRGMKDSAMTSIV